MSPNQQTKIKIKYIIMQFIWAQKKATLTFTITCISYVKKKKCRADLIYIHRWGHCRKVKFLYTQCNTAS